MSKYRGDMWIPNLDEEHIENMKTFLHGLGLFSYGITMEDIEKLSAALAANHGTPDKILIDPQSLEDILKLTGNINNLKP